MTKNHLGSIYLATAATIWGGMYVVSKVVLTVIQPLELVWLRYVVALMMLIVVGVGTRQSCPAGCSGRRITTASGC